MWRYVGIVRQSRQLRTTLKKLESFTPRIEKILSRGVNREILELRSIHTVALLITEVAIARKKSLGAHYVSTFSE